MSFSCQPVEQASKQREGAVIDARKEGMRARERQQATTTNHSLSRGSLLSINRIKSMISSTNREHQCDVDVCHTHNVLVGRLCIRFDLVSRTRESAARVDLLGWSLQDERLPNRYALPMQVRPHMTRHCFV